MGGWWGEGRRNEVTLKIVLQHIIFCNGRRFQVVHVLWEMFLEVDINPCSWWNYAYFTEWSSCIVVRTLAHRSKFTCSSVIGVSYQYIWFWSKTCKKCFSLLQLIIAKCTLVSDNYSQWCDWKLEKQGLYVLAGVPLNIVNSSVCPFSVFYAMAVTVVKIHLK